MTSSRRRSSCAPVGQGASESLGKHNSSVSPSKSSTCAVVNPVVESDYEDFTKVEIDLDEIEDQCYVCNFALDFGDDEEVLNPKVRKGPVEPTREEIEYHNITHLPFRNWCDHCVKGKGVSNPHLKSSPQVKLIGGLHFDYWFPRDAPGKPKITVFSMRDVFFKRAYWSCCEKQRS